MISSTANHLMEYKTTIAASGVSLDLVQWIDKQAKLKCTNRSTIIRQILTQRLAEESGSMESMDKHPSQEAA